MRASVVAAIALAGLLTGAWARAQPAPDLLSLGKQEFDVGQREFNLGRYDGALEHFEASYRLTARPGLLFNIGVTERRLFARTRKLTYLENAIEHFRAALASIPAADPAQAQVRSRCADQLREAEAELAGEQAARARGEERLTVGEQLLSRGRIVEAREQLAAYLASPERERGGVARAWMLEGGLRVAEGKLDAAVEAYASALALDRGRRLDRDAPPEAQATFSRAVERLGAAPPVGVRHTPPGLFRTGRPMELAFEPVGDGQQLLSGLSVFYRSGAGAFSSVSGPVGKVTLPALFTGALAPGARVEYYAVAYDRNAAPIEHLGSASLPFAVDVERPRRTSIARRPWFWTVLGLSAAAVATGIGLAVHYTQPPSYDVPVQVKGLEAR